MFATGMTASFCIFKHDFCYFFGIEVRQTLVWAIQNEFLRGFDLVFPFFAHADPLSKHPLEPLHENYDVTIFTMVKTEKVLRNSSNGKRLHKFSGSSKFAQKIGVLLDMLCARARAPTERVVSAAASDGSNEVGNPPPWTPFGNVHLSFESDGLRSWRRPIRVLCSPRDKNATKVRRSESRNLKRFNVKMHGRIGPNSTPGTGVE
jgi:hypothetical protein